MPASLPTPTSATSSSDESSLGVAADTATSKALGSLMSHVFHQPSQYEESTKDVPDTDSHLSGTDHRLLHKTRACIYYHSDRGCVHGDSCVYAHGAEDLKIAPDLRKTTICDKWWIDACPLSAAECKFAHGREDLRAVEMSTTRSQASTISPTPVFDRHRREVMTPVVKQTPVKTRDEDPAYPTSWAMETPIFTSEESLETSGILSTVTPVRDNGRHNVCPSTPEESVDALTQLVGTLQQQHAYLQALVAAQEAQILMHQQQQALDLYLKASQLNPSAAVASLLGLHSYSQYECPQSIGPVPEVPHPFSNHMVASSFAPPAFPEHKPAGNVMSAHHLGDVQMTPSGGGSSSSSAVGGSAEKRTILLNDELN